MDGSRGDHFPPRRARPHWLHEEDAICLPLCHIRPASPRFTRDHYIVYLAAVGPTHHRGSEGRWQYLGFPVMAIFREMIAGLIIWINPQLRIDLQGARLVTQVAQVMTRGAQGFITSGQPCGERESLAVWTPGTVGGGWR